MNIMVLKRVIGRIRRKIVPITAVIALVISAMFISSMAKKPTRTSATEVPTTVPSSYLEETATRPQPKAKPSTTKLEYSTAVPTTTERVTVPVATVPTTTVLPTVSSTVPTTSKPTTVNTYVYTTIVIPRIPVAPTSPATTTPSSYSEPVSTTEESSTEESSTEESSAEDTSGTLLGNYSLTAYCPCYECSEGWDRQTSSGATATSGRTVACNSIPAGSHIRIEGYGTYVVEDTGGGLGSHTIDIFFDTHWECEQFGRRSADVYLLD